VLCLIFLNFCFQFQGCVDYIFFSKEKLFLKEALSVPTLEEEKTLKINKTKISDNKTKKTVTNHSQKTESIESDDENKDDPDRIIKEWNEQEAKNNIIKRKWLPNAIFTSDHFCLCATLGFKSSTIASTWN